MYIILQLLRKIPRRPPSLKLRSALSGLFKKYMNTVTHVVFDLDNTLIDAGRVKWFFRQLAFRHGFDEEQAREIYKQARNEEDGKIAITDIRYLDFLEKALVFRGKEMDKQIVVEVFSEIQQEKEKLLFPGVVELIEFCKQKNIKCSLLSLGVKDWQKKKINWVGLDRYFDSENTIFTVKESGGKKEALQKMFGDEFSGKNVVLFNDRPDESGRLLDAFPYLKIFLRRDVDDLRHDDVEWNKFSQKYEGRVVVAKNIKTLLSNFIEYVG